MGTEAGTKPAAPPGATQDGPAGQLSSDMSRREEFSQSNAGLNDLQTKVINTIGEEPTFINIWGEEPKGKRQEES